MKIPEAAGRLIEILSLESHPEGGYFRQTYRAAGEIPGDALPPGFNGARVFSTAIYYLLSGEDFSALHRIRSDELWHFYSGSSVEIHIIQPHGEYDRIRLGADFEQNEVFQAVVPAGCWFGAHLVDQYSYALVGCTVAPGFHFDDFDLGKRADLCRQYPQHIALIERLTRI
jgi:uncharacterized protein